VRRKPDIVKKYEAIPNQEERSPCVKSMKETKANTIRDFYPDCSVRKSPQCPNNPQKGTGARQE
jgi:hypothetical protein